MKVLFLAIFLISCAFAAPLLHADTDVEDIVPDQYIIVLKNSITSQQKTAHMLALQQHIQSSPDAAVAEEVRGEFDFEVNGFKGFFATLSKAKLAEELAHPDVKYIELNKIVKLNYKMENLGEKQDGATWGLCRTSQRYLPLDTAYYYNMTNFGECDAYIVDTGIYTAHDEFEGTRAFYAFNAITNEPEVDENGHGTHVAGTVGGKVYGIHKAALLYAIKVLGRTGSGTWEGVIAGLNHIPRHRRRERRAVANMSLGGGKNQAVDDAVNACAMDGTTMVVAAGNNNWDACQYSPASATGAITVGATASNDARATFSNYGTCVDLFAPGQSITSAWIGSPSAISTISGTSMASPHVCGVSALHLEVDGNLKPEEIRAWLRREATENVVGNPGTGSPNRLLYAPHIREE